MRPLRIAVLAKQVPAFEEMRLGADGRLQREGLPLEMNPYCRRAVAKGVELAQDTRGRCTVLTLGPKEADEVLSEAIAWGADEGVLISDPAFAGSDTLATARALAAAIKKTGPYDLVIAGLNSVDADTGQVGPQLAELLDLPFLSGVKELEIDGTALRARCERDNGYVTALANLPSVITAAERLCPPCKVPPEERRPTAAIRTLTARDLGDGPWGQAGSPTEVGAVRVLASSRRRRLLDGPIEDQVRTAVAMLRESGALNGLVTRAAAPQAGQNGIGVIAVLAEPFRDRLTRELLGGAAALGGRAVVLAAERIEVGHELVLLRPAPTAEDFAVGATAWARAAAPWAILAPSTSWGREVAARLAVRLEAGLTGDAVELEVVDGRLVCWKPAFGGQLVAAVTARSAVQMATIRPGVLTPATDRRGGPSTILRVKARHRVRVVERVSDDDPVRLATARVVVGVGQGVDPGRYQELKPLLDLLGAELAATRKVTDRGWLPRSRQLGITGRAISPSLYIALGASGKFNHVVGVRGATFVIAVNNDAAAPVFERVDAGIVGDWSDVVPLLVRELRTPTD